MKRRWLWLVFSIVLALFVWMNLAGVHDWRIWVVIVLLAVTSLYLLVQAVTQLRHR